MLASENEILQIEQATDIVRLISEQIALKPKGREFLGLCPFHDDKSPSLHVSPVKQIYKCFSCGAGGNVYSFMMNYHKLSFPEALEFLAQRAGITLSNNQTEKHGQNKTVNQRQKIETANSLALEFFQKQLNSDSGRAARQYIQTRNINSAMVKNFALGFAPDSWDNLSKQITSKKWDLKGFEATGLVQKRESGGYFDKLRNRLIFPIFDSLGKPIAFGGRILNSEDNPKYLNSPETPLFNKSATLYGLHLAIKPIIDSKTAVVVEGYTDVIACHQAGIENVVATLGTALTKQHAAKLRRYSEKLILIFDPDEAGQKAADRAVDIFLTENLDVYIATLAGGQDPADLLNIEDGRKLWDDSIEQAKPALEYQFQRISKQIGAAETITGKERIIGDYLQNLVRSGLNQVAPIKKSSILKKLSDLLKLNEQQIKKLISSTHGWQKNNKNSTGKLALDDSLPKITALGAAELQIIGSLLKNNELFHHSLANGQSIDEAILPQEMSTPALRELYQKIYDKLADGQSLTLTGLLAILAKEDKQNLANLATRADTNLDELITAAGDSDNTVKEILQLAINKIEQHKNNLNYLKRRDSLAKKDIKEIDKTLREYLSKPNAVRIARKNR